MKVTRSSLKQLSATVIGKLRRTGVLERGIDNLQDRCGLSEHTPQPQRAHRGKAPLVSKSSDSYARTIVYTPDMDGQADPGEVVWTWVSFEEDEDRGKDRPVLVVGHSGPNLLGLMMSSRDKRADDENWIAVGSGPWDAEGRRSFVRLDRVIEVPEDGIRREGAIMPRRRFEMVAKRLRQEYGWA